MENCRGIALKKTRFHLDPMHSSQSQILNPFTVKLTPYLFKHILSCSPDPITNFETTNPRFSRIY